MSRVRLEKRLLGLLAVAAIVVFALTSLASAQVVGGKISGTVVDSSGAKTPNVSVALTNIATGVVSNAVTNAVGVFSIPNLQPGNYQVTASASGFSTLERSGITLTVGQELVLNLTLQIGEVTQHVTVNAEAPNVN